MMGKPSLGWQLLIQSLRQRHDIRYLTGPNTGPQVDRCEFGSKGSCRLFEKTEWPTPDERQYSNELLNITRPFFRLHKT